MESLNKSGADIHASGPYVLKEILTSSALTHFEASINEAMCEQFPNISFAVKMMVMTMLQASPMHLVPSDELMTHIVSGVCEKKCWAYFALECLSTLERNCAISSFCMIIMQRLSML